MQNVKVADNMVERTRDLIASSTVGDPVREIRVQDLIDILESLERLATIERHLANLVSPAYEPDHE